MSIIHEALKKTGHPITTEVQKNPAEVRPGFRPELLGKKKRGNAGSFIALAVLVLVAAPVVAPLLNNPSKNTREISVGSALPSGSSGMRQQFAIEEAPLPMMPNLSRTHSGRAGRFSLSGLVYSADGSYCLINGKVVRVGERVGDATLMQVTPSEAILDFRGEKIVLTADAG